LRHKCGELNGQVFRGVDDQNSARGEHGFIRAQFAARAAIAIGESRNAALVAGLAGIAPTAGRPGRIILLPSAYSKAAEYANLNAGYLHSRSIYPSITNIAVDQGRRAVFVSMAANTNELVPLIGNLTLRGSGEAQVRLDIAQP